MSPGPLGACCSRDEVCDDGLDNDYDRLIDGEDPDCCGDGVTDPPETCDDGNTIDCDGCSDTCEVESCGDGKICLALGEDCDDGNTASCDGCSDVCRVEYCGDGVICGALGEECEVDAHCGIGYLCDDTCTCRSDGTLVCGASTSGREGRDERKALNITLLVVPLFFLVTLRWRVILKRERVRTRGWPVCCGTCVPLQAGRREPYLKGGSIRNAARLCGGKWK